ncbi:MAG: outer membrane lipoprotein LolB [Betaproteobacteria bacterium]|nr:MAG: outer membrane lipoprotein LolB [Betaproteobacteria bacterium]
MARDPVRAFRGFTLGGLLALLVACATQPPVAPPTVAPQVDRFELSGRVAVKLDGRGHSARLRWLHDVDSDAIWLYSPVGSTIATLVANEEIATLVTSKKETFQSTDVQSLTRDVLGWDLPLGGLKYWVLGRVDPDAPVEQIEWDGQQRIKRLVQDGWDIEFAGYAKNSTLPASIVLRFADLRMRLLIDRWDVALLEQ